MPALPPKSVLKRFHPRFLEKRRAGLQYFLKFVEPQPLHPSEVFARPFMLRYKNPGETEKK